jgi:hypothetical protein
LPLSLFDQCQTLDVPLEHQALRYENNRWCCGTRTFPEPEAAALEFFREQGWVGAACEGGPILLTLKASCFEFLASTWRYGRRSAAKQAFQSLCFHGKVDTDDLLAEIAYGIRSGFFGLRRRKTLSNFGFIYSHDSVQSTYPSVEPCLVSGLLELLGRDLVEIGRVFATDPYKYRAGWPDLTLTKENKIRFIEVKTTDLLHQSQISIITDIAKPLNLPFSVLQLHRARAK